MRWCCCRWLNAADYHEPWRWAGAMEPPGAGMRVSGLFQMGCPSLRQKIAPDEQRRLVRDTLIARTCKRDSVTLVTADEDFQKIQRFCAFKLIHPKDYF